MVSQIFCIAGAVLLNLISSATAQLSTKCNPTINSTCPTDVGLTDNPHKTDFSKGADSRWTSAIGTDLTYGSNGAEFIIKTETDSPTITTNFYIFFGYVEVKMRAAPGTGIVSSIVLESDDLDEIDWEWLGGNNTSVETNYFGKGNTTSYDRAIYYPVSTPNDEFHTYAINWTSSSIQWIIDGTTVRTLNYEDAVGGKNFPQTPCKVALGVWAAGTSAQAEGTIEWAGGLTDFTRAPFTMYVQSVTIQNYNPGMNYHWTDLTGDYTSIQVVNTTNSNNSTTIASAHKPSSLANPDGVVSGNASTSAAGKGTSSAASASGSAFVQASGAAGLVSGSSWVLLFGVACVFVWL